MQMRPESAGSPPLPTIFIGCATDRKFVMPTSVMLSSLDDNGEVPDAVVLVADFGLNEADRVLLRDSAGRLGPKMRFVPIDETSPKIVAMPSKPIPLALLGRLILPREVDRAGARLLLIDSDMIVNASLQPLFALDMAGRPLAAAQDPLMELEYRHHQKKTPVYFNAGLMLLDVDVFNARSVGEEAMYRLATYDPMPIYMDQCALNEILDGDWLALDRRWNFFQTGYDRQFEREDYAAVQIIHYAGPKPWDHPHHPGAPIWNHHATRTQQKTTGWRDIVNRAPVDAPFVAMQFEVLLGRQLESEQIARERAALSRIQATAVLLSSEEFGHRVLTPIAQGSPFQAGRFESRPSTAQILWAAESLAVLPRTADDLRKATSWHDLISALARDVRLMETAGLAPIERIADKAPERATLLSEDGSTDYGNRSRASGFGRFLGRSRSA